MTWTALHDRVHQTLRQQRLVQRQQRLLVAVSGGQDSLCLLKIMLDLQPKWCWQLAIAHCNHRWRSDAEANAAHVQNLAAQWQISCYTETTTRVLNSEATAREWRYQALSAIARANQYACIVTGHTQSDRAETLLLNLLRGSGADGLQALSWHRPSKDIQIIRPLLAVRRSETAQFCQEFALPVWQDATNQDLKYRRNRVRLELLPYLRRHFNPQIEQSLAQTAELLQAEVSYLETAAQDLLQTALSRSEPNTPFSPTCLNREVLRQAPLALQRRALRQFLQLELDQEPEFEHVEKIMALITANNRSQTDPFPGGAIAIVDHPWIYLQ